MIEIIQTYRATVCFTAPTAYRVMLKAMADGAARESGSRGAAARGGVDWCASREGIELNASERGMTPNA